VKSDSSHAGPRNDRCKEAIHDPPNARHRGRHDRESLRGGGGGATLCRLARGGAGADRDPR
jgi:hypothetical protein